MVRVEEHRHDYSPFDFSLADQAAQARDLNKRLIASKDADNFTVPGLTPSPGKVGLKLREFFLDALQSSFKLSCRSRHVFIIGCNTRKNNGFDSKVSPITSASKKSE